VNGSLFFPHVASRKDLKPDAPGEMITVPRSIGRPFWLRGANVELKPTEIAFGVLLVITLLGLSLFFGQRQFASLRRLRTLGAPLDDEGQYERRKVRLRLASCALTLLMAAQITVILATHERTLGRVARQREGVDPAVEPTDEQRLLVRVYVGEWIAVLLVMLVVLVLAALDLWATRRFAFRQYRKISDDRRAMIQRQVNRMREQKNGET
jgi:hypothetical protein